MTRETETIVAAALRRRDVIYSAPPPARHGDLMRMVDENHGDMHAVFSPEEQGFLTNTGQFVTRFKARQIAVRSGQIKEAKWPPDLYSEDLW